MGSVIDYIECPNCEQEAYSDFYYKTGEEYVNCMNCGYHHSATIKNRDKKLNELKKELEESLHIGVQIETVQLSRFVDGEIKVEMIIDNGPKSDSAGFSTEDR